MTEGFTLALRWAFRSLRLHRVEANIQPGNKPSRALVRGLGFRREGLSRRDLKVAGRGRDHERWALLAEDWRRRRKGGSGSWWGRAFGACWWASWAWSPCPARRPRRTNTWPTA